MRRNRVGARLEPGSETDGLGAPPTHPPQTEHVPASHTIAINAQGIRKD
jgi:hypothetical protein